MTNATKEAYRLAAYADLKRDEDVRVSASQERSQTAVALLSSIGEATSWMSPEIIAIGADRVHAFEGQSPELEKLFGHYLDGVLRAAPHTLSAEAEAVVAATANLVQQPNAIYSQLSNGDLPYPTITLSEGTQVRLDTSAYEKYRQAGNRADRKLVFDSFWNTWTQYQGTFGQTLATQVMGCPVRRDRSPLSQRTGRRAVCRQHAGRRVRAVDSPDECRASADVSLSATAQTTARGPR